MFDEFSPLFSIKMSRVVSWGLIKEHGLPPIQCCKPHRQNTLNFLDDRNINYISQYEWMPKRLDVAPMDFGIWGKLKRPLQKRRIRKVRKRAKIKNRYKQAPHLTQDTNGKVTTSQVFLFLNAPLMTSGTNWNSLSSAVYFLAGQSVAILSISVMVYKLNIY